MSPCTQTQLIVSGISFDRSTANTKYVFFSAKSCDVIGAPLTHVTATVFSASGGPAQGGVSVFHRREFRWTIEARAGHVAAPVLRAHTLPTILVGGVADQNVTIRALEGVAVPRVRDCIFLVVCRNMTRGIFRSSLGLRTA